MRRSLFVPLAFCAVALLSPAAATAQDANSARTFVDGLYRHYTKNAKGIDFTGPKAGLYFHSSLLALIEADGKAAGPDNVPYLDGDPICSCQDWSGIFDLKIDVQVESPQRAEATVTFALFPATQKQRDWRKLKFTLVPEHGEWRIYDILDSSDPKAPLVLRAELKKDIDSYAKASKAGPVK